MVVVPPRPLWRQRLASAITLVLSVLLCHSTHAALPQYWRQWNWWTPSTLRGGSDASTSNVTTPSRRSRRRRRSLDRHDPVPTTAGDSAEKLFPEQPIRGRELMDEHTGAMDQWRRRRRRDSGNAPTNATTITSPVSSMLDKHAQQLNLRRREFFDRIALASSSLMRQQEARARLVDAREHDQDGMVMDAHATTPQSDLTRPGRHFHVVTTAALPWFTGTAVNPLLRAAYLHRYTQQLNAAHAARHNASTTATHTWVTLVIPWLELTEDQQELYGRVFANETVQDAYIRDWLHDEADMPDVAAQLDIVFYPARYHAGLGSIFAMGDMLATLLQHSNVTDVCVMEEPEHCNFYRAPGDGWTQTFDYVIGVMHTNYREYASAHYTGLWSAPALAMISSAMVRAYCHQVIKLSDALQAYAPEKEVTANVHGVRLHFLQAGQARALERRNRRPQLTDAATGSSVFANVNGTQAYFIGKLLWAKGLDLMLELQDQYKQYTGTYFDVAIYGSGPDERDIQRAFHGRRRSKDGDDNGALSSDSDTDSVLLLEDVDDDNSNESLQAKAKRRLAKIKQTIHAVEVPRTLAEFRKRPIPATFPGRVDHATLADQYKIFINPSLSEVLCTTTAEALAMGKFVIVPMHPSNTFFFKFSNCLAYRNKFEFVANLRWALTHEPDPLTDDELRQFTWEAATERLIAAARVTAGEARERERLGKTKLDERIAWFHNEISKGATGDMLRAIFGAGPVSRQVQYQMERSSLGKDSSPGEENADSADGEEADEDDSQKFKRSSFVAAIESTLRDLSFNLKVD